MIDAEYVGPWELPVLSEVDAPPAVLIRPDGYVAWVGDLTDPGLPDALTNLVRTADCDVTHRLPRSQRSVGPNVTSSQNGSRWTRTVSPARQSELGHTSPIASLRQRKETVMDANVVATGHRR
jgi:hypothetical protein